MGGRPEREGVKGVKTWLPDHRKPLGHREKCDLRKGVLYPVRKRQGKTRLPRCDSSPVYTMAVSAVGLDGVVHRTLDRSRKGVRGGWGTRDDHRYTLV